MTDDLVTTEEAGVILGIKPQSVGTLVQLLKLTPANGRGLKSWQFRRSECERRKAEREAATSRRKPFMRGAARRFQ